MLICTSMNQTAITSHITTKLAHMEVLTSMTSMAMDLRTMLLSILLSGWTTRLKFICFFLNRDGPVTFTLECWVGADLLWTQTGILHQTGEWSEFFTVSVASDPNERCRTCSGLLDTDPGNRRGLRGLATMTDNKNPPPECTVCIPPATVTDYWCYFKRIFLVFSDCSLEKPNPERTVYDAVFDPNFGALTRPTFNQDQFSYWAKSVVARFGKGGFTNLETPKTLRQIQNLPVGDAKCGAFYIMQALCYGQMVDQYSGQLQALALIAGDGEAMKSISKATYSTFEEILNEIA
jgi:hypothetical protein